MIAFSSTSLLPTAAADLAGLHMGKPFSEGTGWAFRLRAHGQDIYRSGYPSEAAARKAQAAIVAELEQCGKAAGLGPHATTLAVAFSDYARQRLPYLKGGQC